MARKSSLLLGLTITLATLSTLPAAAANGANPCEGFEPETNVTPSSAVEVVAFNASHSDASFDEYPTLAAGASAGNLRQEDLVDVRFKIDAEEECVLVTFASYERLPGAFHWTLFDWHSEAYPADGETWRTPRIEMPDCNFAVYFAVGDVLLTLTPATQYFDDTIDGKSGMGDAGCRLDEVCPPAQAEALPEGDVRITWQDTGFSKYNVWRAEGPVFTYKIRDVINGTDFVDGTTEVGKTYRYIIEPFQHKPETTCPFVETTSVPFFPNAWMLVGVGVVVVSGVALHHRRRRQ